MKRAASFSAHGPFAQRGRRDSNPQPPDRQANPIISPFGKTLEKQTLATLTCAVKRPETHRCAVFPRNEPRRDPWRTTLVAAPEPLPDPGPCPFRSVFERVNSQHPLGPLAAGHERHEPFAARAYARPVGCATAWPP